MLALDAAPIASTSALPPYSPPPPSYDSHDADVDEHLTAYDSHLTLEPWLAILRRPTGDLDPCKYDVQTDSMYEAVADWVKAYIRERMPTELRNAARSLACRSQPLEPLPLNPLFLDALHGAPPTAPPTSPSPYTHWMLDSLCLANRALQDLWRMPLPLEDLDALIKALFVLQCRERFRRAARRRAVEREGSVVRKLLASAGWAGAEGKWKKGGKASR